MAPDKNPEAQQAHVIHAWNANRQGLNPTELVHKPNNGPCAFCGAGASVLGDYGYWQEEAEGGNTWYTWIPRCFGCFRQSSDYPPDREEAPVHDLSGAGSP